MAAVESEAVPKGELNERMAAVIGRLEREAIDRVGKRQPIEQRWLEDLRQYHGKYESQIDEDLRKAKKSRLYVNDTRAKTNAMEARLSDMLFPTDDRNWGIGPTPVPELTVQSEQAAKRAYEAKTAHAANPEDPQLQQQAADADQQLALLKAQMEEARKRARAMEEEIDDHLRECRYPAQSRLIIRDACKLGTGVIKGPIADTKSRRSWQQAEGETNVYNLKYASDKRPAFWRVDPWNFFPDMDATSMEDCESVYERHLFNRKQVRRLARQAGFDKEAIRRLLLEKPDSSVPTYLADLRSITSSYSQMMGDRYHVWEYHGPLTVEDMKLLIVGGGKEALAEDLDAELDPLDEVQVVMWFCQGQLLKLGFHHLDSCDSIYSVFNLEKDEATVFGFGIPYIIRDPQKALAGAWRTLMDNMGLSSGPQIVINEDAIEPANGEWTIEPRKVWKRKGNAPADKKPFETYNIESHMPELMEVINLSKQFIDDESALPMLAQGDQASHITKTAGGMSILMNSVNIVFRRIVKNWDDDITEPAITRMYDWLMQFSPKEYIKGDYDVDARGTSVLLVREMQSANLLAFLAQFGAHPTLAKYLKDGGLPALRRLAQVLMIPADEVVKTDSEVAEDEAEAANLPAPPDPEMEKIAAEMNRERMRGRNALQLEEMRRETALIELAAKNNMELDKLKAKLQDGREERAHKERIFASEAAMEERLAAQGQHEGSGGYLP